MSVMRERRSGLGERGISGVLAYVKQGYVNRGVRTRPGLVGTSFGSLNNSQLGELVVFCSCKRILSDF